MRAEDWKSFIYDLPKDFNPSSFIMDFLRENEILSVKRISFKSPFRSPFKVNNTVYVELFEPHLKSVDAFLLFVHGFGLTKRKKALYSFLPERLARLGLRSAFITLPYHLERTPPGKSSSAWFRDFNDVETAAFFHQAVLDIRSAVRLLKCDDTPFIAGISLGAMISVIALAVEEGLKGGFLILGGGNLERIVWRSLFRLFANEEGCGRRECHRLYRRYPDYLREVESKGSWRDVDLPKICFLFDPLTFAPFVRGKKVVMINSLFDAIIPLASALELWKALGKPEIHWLPSTHGLTVLWGRKIARIIFDKIKIGR